jgi:hypothetical protein
MPFNWFQLVSVKCLSIDIKMYVNNQSFQLVLYFNWYQKGEKILFQLVSQLVSVYNHTPIFLLLTKGGELYNWCYKYMSYVKNSLYLTRAYIKGEFIWVNIKLFVIIKKGEIVESCPKGLMIIYYFDDNKLGNDCFDDNKHDKKCFDDTK